MLAAVLALVLAPIVCIVVYRLFFHSLAGVPGPRLAAVSNVWYAYHVRHGRLLHLAETLHKKYGPAVRVGPNEVWFNSEEAFRAIYSPSHGLEKSDFYLATVLFRPRMDWRHPSQVVFPDTLDLLSERDMTRYLRQRRLIAPVYQASNMRKFGVAVDGVLERVVAELQKVHSDEGQSDHVLDLKEWMHMVAVESLGATVLSWSPGFVKCRSDHGSSAAGYNNWRRKSVFGLFSTLVIADLHIRWISRCFALVWRLGYSRRADYQPLFVEVGQRVSARIRQFKSLLRAKKVKTNKKPKAHASSPDLMADLIALHAAKPDLFSETYLRRLAVTNFGAGHETLCSALTAVITMLGTHPDVLRRLQAEIRLSCSLSEICSARDAFTHLPLTWACIRESQRLHPAIAMSLSRTVAVAVPPSSPLVLHGHIFPAGTIVGCSPPALHRNPAIFGPDPDVFIPDRWLSASDIQRRRMERVNLTWGGSYRTCPGRHLAELILYRAVIALVRAFDITAEMPPADQIRYYFLAMLTGAKAEFLPAPDDERTGHAVG